jgi:hypothetical protein
LLCGWSVWFIWFVWSFWFVLLFEPEKPNKLNKPNEPNKRDKPERVDRATVTVLSDEAGAMAGETGLSYNGIAFLLVLGLFDGMLLMLIIGQRLEERSLGAAEAS